uniref:Uncharacterized protein n=1 Tax=Romanomermis culicivorax TaxID=13658 RepID=A0A915JH85_ROMCU
MTPALPPPPLRYATPVTLHWSTTLKRSDDISVVGLYGLKETATVTAAVAAVLANPARFGCSRTAPWNSDQFCTGGRQSTGINESDRFIIYHQRDVGRLVNGFVKEVSTLALGVAQQWIK